MLGRSWGDDGAEGAGLRREQVCVGRCCGLGRLVGVAGGVLLFRCLMCLLNFGTVWSYTNLRAPRLPALRESPPVAFVLPSFLPCALQSCMFVVLSSALVQPPSNGVPCQLAKETGTVRPVEVEKSLKKVGVPTRCSAGPVGNAAGSSDRSVAAWIQNLPGNAIDSHTHAAT